MTLIERWMDPDGSTVRFRVNGCLGAEIWAHEVYGQSVDVHAPRIFRELAMRRLTPLVWHAMPGHES